MFKNTKTGASASELRGYQTEEEADAKRRLEAAGWSFSGVDYEWDDDKAIFETTKIDTEAERKKAFP